MAWYVYIFFFLLFKLFQHFIFTVSCLVLSDFNHRSVFSFLMLRKENKMRNMFSFFREHRNSSISMCLRKFLLSSMINPVNHRSKLCVLLPSYLEQCIDLRKHVLLFDVIFIISMFTFNCIMKNLFIITK